MPEMLCMPNVRSRQPPIPRLDQEAAWGDRHSTGSGSQTSHVSNLRGNASPPFVALLDQLLRQHVMEVSKLPPRDPQREPQREPQKPTRRISHLSAAKVRVNDRQGSECSEVSDNSGASEASQSGFNNLKNKRKSRVPAMLEEGAPEFQELQEQFMSSINQPDEETSTPDLRNLLGHDESEEYTSEEQRRSKWKRLKAFLQSARYEMCVAGLLCVNVLWMAWELQFSGNLVGLEIGVYDTTEVSNESWQSWELFFTVGDLAFTVLFTLDVMVRASVLQCKFWKVPLNYIDVAVSATSIFEVAVYYGNAFPVNPILFRLLRIGKLARAIRMVTMNSVLASLQLLIKCIGASANMLFWSFCLLTFVQCVAGMVASTLCRDFISDETQSMLLREEVFRFYGTFTRTFLTMFEILFANWSPPCRVLVENISEWFSIFFLLYRCVLGFAVLNVVNAVFVQQTMKTASSDEELAFKQKERDVALYTRKVKKLFQSMDSSGDGSINKEEFSKLVNSPMLKFWMGQLELEYHDLMSLFEFLDNGDGEITLMEFIEGAARLRGGAKALDIWRIETKLEVLFAEVLGVLRGDKDVQLVFENSTYQHIRATDERRRGGSMVESHATDTCDARLSDGVGPASSTATTPTSRPRSSIGQMPEAI
ncbi:Catsper1 [Symbiodinium natans]|uniref:Catsper1 protein n=1 Tax=Symbiodinium natans TaxID=878477 RepID=A0A812N5B2_9DINO|nr:Catsper1 [Symbiodinium natans]